MYFEETQEEYLAYTGDFVAYEKAMGEFVMPSTSEFLLQHLHALHAFLDAIYEALYDRECEKLKAEGTDRFSMLYEAYDEAREEEIDIRNAILDMLQYDKIYNTVFRWHGDIMTRQGEAMTGAYAVSYFSSWGACARSFHLFICSFPDKMPLYANTNASEHAYCQMTSKRANVVVSDAAIIDYGVDDLWNSMRIITPTLYLYSFSPSMRTYIYAIFLRYADLVSTQQADEDFESAFDNPLSAGPTAISEEEGQEEEIDDTFDAFKKLSIRANESYSINNEFLYEGEAIFYHQLYRIQISSDLIRYHKRKEVPILVDYVKLKVKRVDMLKLMLEKWYAMCVTVSKDTFLKQTLIEKYTNMRAEMHLYHGDRERYKRNFPNSAADARDILQEARVLEMTAINNTQSMVLADLFTVFRNAYSTAFQELAHDGSTKFEERVFAVGDEGWATINYEQEVLLLTKLSTQLYFELQRVKECKGVQEAFILEEMSTLQSIEERVFLKRSSDSKKVWPLFLKLMRIYYVIDTKSERVFKSLFFAEAYFVWLCLSLRAKLIEEHSLHPELLAMVKKLNTVIQC